MTARQRRSIVFAAALAACAPPAFSATSVVPLETLPSDSGQLTGSPLRVLDNAPQFVQFNPEFGRLTDATVSFTLSGTASIQCLAPIKPFATGTVDLRYGGFGSTSDFNVGDGAPHDLELDGGAAHPVAGSFHANVNDAAGFGLFAPASLTSDARLNQGLFPTSVTTYAHLNAQITYTYDTSPGHLTAPDTTNFGYTLVGATNTRAVTVTNAGGLPTTASFSPVFFSNRFTPTTPTPATKVYGGKTLSRTYTHAPFVRGNDSAIVTVYDANNTVTTVYLGGTAVAPVAELASTTVNAGTVRAGTTSAATLTVRNTGDGSFAVANTDPAGKLAAHAPTPFEPAGGFSLTTSPYALVPDNWAAPFANFQTFTYAYAPTERGTTSQLLAVHTDNGNPDGTNTDHDLPFTLTGTAVGPVFQLDGHAPDETLKFPRDKQPTTLSLLLANLTPDVPLGDLTLLTLSATVDNDPANAFTLKVDPRITLDPLHGAPVEITFDPTGFPENQLIQATLTIHTDQNAPTGDLAHGQTFTFPLLATTVPEPTTLSTACGLALLPLLTRRRHQS